MNSREEKIKELLTSTGRLGIDKLITYLDSVGYFKSPASTKFHCNYEGGLAEHSYNVLKNFSKFNEMGPLGLSADTIVITALMHDLCKAGAYIKNDKGYYWNKQHPKGHGLLSIRRLRDFITISDLEFNLIKFHMGPWNSVQVFGTEKGEYTILDMTNAWNTNKAVKFLYFADEMATVQEGKP